MMNVHSGQCGLCNHFGEHHPNQQQIVNIRVSGRADEEIVDECGHPQHASLHLRVTPISGCDGFEPAPQVPGRA